MDNLIFYFNIKFKIIIIFIITNTIYFIFKYIIKISSIYKCNIKQIDENLLEKSFINIEKNYKFFKLTYFYYSYSFLFNRVKVEFNIGFYDNNSKIIIPSDLTLKYNLHIICNIQISNINIDFLPNIYQNQFFNCIQYFKMNEKVELGIKIYKEKEIIHFFHINIFKFIFNFNYLSNKIDDIFDQLFINQKYILLKKDINNNKLNKTLKLKKSFIKYPITVLIKDTLKNNDKWIYENIYNTYFCFCRGYKCLDIIIDQSCKYYFYLNIIDNNRYIYNKTEYLFIDFIYNKYSSDDVYPVFLEMEKQNLPVHYLTEKLDIYNKFCYKIDNCLKIIHVNKNNSTINGDFLEKHLSLILKLKHVISSGGVKFQYLNNLFYNIEYILFICVGHGVSFFKYFLYNEYSPYGSKIYDKLLIPPSDELISIPKKYGWKDENIIKMNLPRWDKYNSNYKREFLLINDTIKNNSIFVMFTWRELKKHKNISPFYFKNIYKLINNQTLKKLLKNKNIILYFTLHHKLEYYKNFFINNQNIHYIEENEISECLSKTNLIISDFSSIIFDIIYRRKPFIIYIPDGKDANIKDIYINYYYELIESIKNGSIIFENKFFEINEVINKIIYYINNNFILDIKLKIFYEKLNLKNENNINKFISYIKNVNIY